MDIQSKNRVLNIPVNYYCNQKCIFCSEWDKKDFGFLRNNPEKYIKKLIEDWKWKYKKIVFTSWEPTLVKNFFDYVDYARSCWYEKISLITNWTTLLDDNIRSKIIEKLDEITVSIHWSCSKIHDMLVWVNWNFSKAIKWVSKLFEERNSSLNILISYVLNKHNLSDLYKSILLFNKILWVDILLINTMRPEWYWKDKISDIWIKYSEFVEYFNWLDQEKIDLIKGYIGLNRLVFMDIPICVLKAWFQQSINKAYWKVEIRDTLSWWKFVSRDNTKDKKYIDICDLCSYKNWCEWIYVDYIRIFWEQEFSKFKN